MRDPSYPVFCAFGAAICVLSLPWHWRARNVSTLLYLGWVLTACLIACVNSILWAGNVDDKAPLWCDISTRFRIGLHTAITTTGLCIQRRLYIIATHKKSFSSGLLGKKELVINLLLGVGFPLFTIPLYYIIQGSRYLIIEDIGCLPATYPTLMLTLTFSLWPVLASFVSFIYAALTIRAFLKTRRKFSEVLSDSGTNLTLSRFFRLMALATTDMACSLPLSLYFLVTDIRRQTLYPYVWEEVHEYLNEVVITTQQEIQSNLRFKANLELSRWSIPGCAFLFFMYFGLSGEAIRQYKHDFWRVAAFFGYDPSVRQSKNQAAIRGKPTTTGAVSARQAPADTSPVAVV